MFSNKESKKEADNAMLSNNIIGKNTVIEGNIIASGNIRIDGKVIGNITVKSKAVIGLDGVIEGNIIAQNAEISGLVNGKLTIFEHIVMKSTAKIYGDISANKLLIELGAAFNGSCKMVSELKQLK